MVRKNSFDLTLFYFIMLTLKIGKNAAALQLPEYNFEKMSGYLGGHMPPTDYTLLGLDILHKDGKYNDYQDVSWHLLFAGDKSAFPS